LISFSGFSEKRNIDDLDEMIDWFNGKNVDLEKHQPSLENKKNIVFQILTYPRVSNSTKLAMVEKIMAEDKTDARVNFEDRCKSTLSNSEELKKIWSKFLDPNATESTDVMESYMIGYKSSPLLNTKEFEQEFFEVVENIFKIRNRTYAQKFFNTLLPGGENLSFYAEKLKEQLTKTGDNQVMAKRVGIALDNVERRIRAYHFSSPDVLKHLLEIDI
jgi:hypothetical protein